MSHLTGQPDDQEQPSGNQPRAFESGIVVSKCGQAKNLSFQLTFLKPNATIDRAPPQSSIQNDERLAGQVAHPFLWTTYAAYEGRGRLQVASTNPRSQLCAGSASRRGCHICETVIASVRIGSGKLLTTTGPDLA